jgi:hypothetical protein
MGQLRHQTVLYKSTAAVYTMGLYSIPYNITRQQFLLKFSFVPVLVLLYSIFLFATQLPSFSFRSDGLYFPFGVFLP